MRTGYYPFQLGQNKCFSLYDGSMDYKLESMVKNAPPADVAAALQAHGLPPHVIVTPYAYLYVKTSTHTVLVDMGAGDFAPSTGKLIANLYAADAAPEEIDAVFITHAHPDHVGGALNKAGEPTFPNVEYFIAKDERGLRGRRSRNGHRSAVQRVAQRQLSVPTLGLCAPRKDAC